MNETKRTSGRGGELLEAARNYEPPTDGRERLLGLLQVGGVAAVATTTTTAGAAGLGGSAAAGSGTATGSGSAAAAGGAIKGGALASGGVLASASKLLAVKPLMIVASLGLAATATVVTVMNESGEPTNDAGTTSQTVVDSEVTERLRSDSQGHVPGADQQQQAAADDAPLSHPALSHPELAPGVPQAQTGEEKPAEERKLPAARKAEPEGETFSSELAALGQARRALRNGKAEEALAGLSEHRARFPKSSLALEREVLTIEALQATGQAQEARSLAQAFVKRHPTSMLAERLRPIAGTAGAPDAKNKGTSQIEPRDDTP